MSCGGLRTVLCAHRSHSSPRETPRTKYPAVVVALVTAAPTKASYGLSKHLDLMRVELTPDITVGIDPKARRLVLKRTLEQLASMHRNIGPTSWLPQTQRSPICEPGECRSTPARGLDCEEGLGVVQRWIFGPRLGHQGHEQGRVDQLPIHRSADLLVPVFGDLAHGREQVWVHRRLAVVFGDHQARGPIDAVDPGQQVDRLDGDALELGLAASVTALPVTPTTAVFFETQVAQQLAPLGAELEGRGQGRAGDRLLMEGAPSPTRDRDQVDRARLDHQPRLSSVAGCERAQGRRDPVDKRRAQSGCQLSSLW